MQNIETEFKIKLNTRLLLLCSFFIGIGKVFLSIFLGPYMLISGIFSMCIFIAKILTLINLKHNNSESKIIGALIMAAGLAYSAYMARLLIIDYKFWANIQIGIIIAVIGFTELTLSIIGIIRYKNKRIQYRYLKLINLASSISAMMLTMFALTSALDVENVSILNGTAGIFAGLLIILVGIYIIIYPNISLYNKIHNVYKSNSKMSDTHLCITLYKSRIYSTIYYEANIYDNIIDGYIKKSKSPLLEYNIFIIILLIVLSEILIFPYAFIALYNQLRSNRIIKKLNEEMKKLNCDKLYEEAIYD